MKEYNSDIGGTPPTPEEEERYINDPENRREARLMYPDETGCHFKLFFIPDPKIAEKLHQKGYEVKKRGKDSRWYNTNIPLNYGEMIMFNDLVLYSTGVLLSDEKLNTPEDSMKYCEKFGVSLHG